MLFFNFLFLETTSTISTHLSSIRPAPIPKLRVYDNGHISVLYGIIFWVKFRVGAQISALAHLFGGKHFSPFKVHILVSWMQHGL